MILGIGKELSVFLQAVCDATIMETQSIFCLSGGFDFLDWDRDLSLCKNLSDK